MKFLPLLLLATTALAVESPPMPDFSASDVNPGSDRRKATNVNVSPRDYLNQASAWYFGREG